MMHKFLAKIFATLAVLVALMATPAMAQATRTWISGVGDDANPCSRTAPCKTFAGAISKTAANGEINVLDPGGFGGVTITKSITLRSDGALAGMLVAGTSGIIINAAATDRIVLDGLDIEGLGTTGNSTNGINILGAGHSRRPQQQHPWFCQCGVRKWHQHQRRDRGQGCWWKTPSSIITGSGYRSLLPTLPVQRGYIIRRFSPILNAGIRVSGNGNFAQISNVVIDRTAKSLDILAGGAVNSFGDNILSPGDAPTLVPKG